MQDDNETIDYTLGYKNGSEFGYRLGTPNQMTFPDFKKFTLLNRTDSVTSDRTVNYVHVPYDVSCLSCPYVGKDDEFNLSFKGPDTIRICPKCGNGHVIATTTTVTSDRTIIVKDDTYSCTNTEKPTETQDELWDELEAKYVKPVQWDEARLDPEAKSHFKIERI